MSNTIMRWSLVPALTALLLGACGGDTLDDATRARVAAAGDSAAMSLVRTLAGRLNAHMADGGPAAAIEFCSTEAQRLTDSIATALGPGWAVKRTTLRTRNTRNAPDSLEAVALGYFQATADTAEPPASLVQVTPSGDYRYYMPLRMGPMCLQCHGERETLDPAVRQVLDARYPADRATGYRSGDFRGLIRVTLPRDAVR